MKKYNLKPEYIRKIRPNYSYKRIEENVQPNIVNRKFNTKGINQIWCTDITYLIFNNQEDIYQQLLIYMIEKLLLIKYLNLTIANL